MLLFRTDSFQRNKTRATFQAPIGNLCCNCEIQTRFGWGGGGGIQVGVDVTYLLRDGMYNYHGELELQNILLLIGTSVPEIPRKKRCCCY